MTIKLNKNKELYVTDMAPNGTNDLVVYDRLTDKIELIPECCFGINIDSGLGLECNVRVLDESGYIVNVLAEEASLTDTHVMPVSLGKVLGNITISPVNDGISTLETLRKLLK